ncbi:MAG: hypothetical protein CL695_05665 [Chloroflexi bacterium]|jgi:hypothetical protein|nr:hypothetical protein [Chloroflexota bacterium]|tara:strand:+ start:131 stop:754 length:624 start_codon:yes stop_codon:yes gene_type:complete
MNQHIFRRFNHTMGACYVVYFLLPLTLFGIERFVFAAGFWFATATVDAMRLRSSRKMPGIRDYEQNRIAGFLWFSSGATILLAAHEYLGVGQAVVIATIIAAAYTDPLLGELKSRLSHQQTLASGIVIAFLIYISIFGMASGFSGLVLGYALVAAVVIVAVEQPSIKWLDDDLLMQLAPVAILLLLATLPGAPQLPNEIVTEMLECC